MRRRAGGPDPLPLRQPGSHCLAIFLAVSSVLLPSLAEVAAAQSSLRPLPVVISAPDTPPGALAQIRLSLRTPHAIASGHLALDLDPAVFGPAVAADVFSANGDQMGLARLNGRHVEVYFRSGMGGIGRVPGMPIVTIAAPVLDGTPAGTRGSIAVSFAGKPWKDVQGYQYRPETEAAEVRVGGRLLIEAVTPGGGLLPAGTKVRIDGPGFTAQTRLEIEGVAVRAASFDGIHAMEVTLEAPAELTGKRVVARNPDGTWADFYPALRGVGNPAFQVAGFQPVFPSQPAWVAEGWPMVQNASTGPIDVTYVARIGAGPYLQYPTAAGRLEPGEIAGGPPVSLANRVSSSAGVSISASKPVRMVTFRTPGQDEDAAPGELIPVAAGTVAPVLTATWVEGKPVCSEDISVGGTEDPACVAWLTGSIRTSSLALNLRASALSIPVTASASTTDGVPWLSVSPEHATVCGGSSDCQGTTFSVKVNPSGLAVGEYRGSVVFTSGNAMCPPRVVPLVLRVSESIISVKPAGGLSFIADADGNVAAPIELKVTSTGAPARISVSMLKEQTNGAWLSITPEEATTPATFTVIADATALIGDVYASVNYLRIAGPANSVTKLVSLYRPVQAPPPAISTGAGNDPILLWAQSGSRTSSTRFLNGGLYPANEAAVTTEGGGDWLTATFTKDSTGASGVLIAANAQNLPAGVYRGNITLTSSTHPEYMPAQAAVTLVTWKDSLPLTVSPESLRLSIPSGGSTGSSCSPEYRLRVSSDGLPVGSTGTAATTDGHAWLKAMKWSEGAVCIVVDARELQPGEYEGSILITATADSQSSITVPVSLSVTDAALPVSNGAPPFGFTMVHGASQTVEPVAPGEVITVRGVNLGPAGGTVVGADVEGRQLTEAGGARLYFDGVAAPLLFVSPGEVQAVAPYEIEGRLFTEIEVESQGMRSLLGGVPVVTAAPGIYTADGSGQGQAEALNEDGSENTAENPADRGTALSFLVTGLGQTTPAGSTGTIAGEGEKRPTLTLAATLGGIEAVVVEASPVVGQVEGVFRVKLRLPEEVPSGPAVPVVLRAGGASSAPGVTIAVK